jgi:hypothetical protein
VLQEMAARPEPQDEPALRVLEASRVPEAPPVARVPVVRARPEPAALPERRARAAWLAETAA